MFKVEYVTKPESRTETLPIVNVIQILINLSKILIRLTGVYKYELSPI